MYIIFDLSGLLHRKEHFSTSIALASFLPMILPIADSIARGKRTAYSF
jgi:hypothetical protein